MRLILHVKSAVLSVQDYSLLAARSIANLFSPPIYWADVFQQADLIGIGSLPIVLLTGFFTGAVLGLQSVTTLATFGAKEVTGSFVTLSMIKELGPVLTGLMVSGRCASGIASELGSMQVTEQIDAMRALGTDPTRKLVTPRILSAVVMLFFLTIVSDATGMDGGAMVGVFMSGLDATQYLHSSFQYLRYMDVLQGLVKPAFFGFVIASVGCFCGLRTRGGTQGVGRSTTQAVVYSSVFIIVVDFLISRVMISIFGR